MQIQEGNGECPAGYNEEWQACDQGKVPKLWHDHVQDRRGKVAEEQVSDVIYHVHEPLLYFGALFLRVSGQNASTSADNRRDGSH